VDGPRLGAEGPTGPLEEIPIAVIVRKASRADQPAIARFIEDAYGPRAQYKATPRWTWQFIDNPFIRPRGDEIPVWVAVDGDRVVGQIAVQNGLLEVEGKTFEAGWAVDIMVLQSHRGAGIGHRLHDAVASDVDILLSLKMAPASRRMAEREGCVTVAGVHQLTRWVRLDAGSVQRYLMLRTANHRRTHRAAQLACDIFQFHRLFPLLANPLLRLRDLVTGAPRGGSATNIAEVDRFGPEIDELWERTRRDYPVIFPRDARFLNWRFVDCPEPRYRRFVAERDGRAVGYVVLRRAEPVELSQGIIVDLYASRGDAQTLDELVRHSLAFFGDDVPAVDCGTSVPELESVLRKHGFFRTRAQLPTCICRDGALRDRLTRLRSNWSLSKGDHDWDQIYLADPGTVAE
jgi:GNAT superfamily N-acetyltransferase